MKIFYVLEFLDDLQHFCNKWNKDGKILSLKPEISAELDQLNMPYTSLQNDYYTHTEYIEMARNYKNEALTFMNIINDALMNDQQEYNNIDINLMEIYLLEVNRVLIQQ